MKLHLQLFISVKKWRFISCVDNTRSYGEGESPWKTLEFLLDIAKVLTLQETNYSKLLQMEISDSKSSVQNIWINT